MAREGVLAEDGDEHAAPLGVGVRSLVEGDDGDEGLHVDDGGSLRPYGLVGGLVLVESFSAEALFLRAARCFSAGFGFGGEATIFGSLGRSGCGCRRVVVMRHRE